MKNVPLINILPSDVHNPDCVLELIDYHEHLSEGSVKHVMYVTELIFLS